jgi:hypothetical protein
LEYFWSISYGEYIHGLGLGCWSIILNFQTTLLLSTQVTRVETAVNGNGSAQSQLNLTPAQVEQLAAEHDDLDDMIGTLEQMGRTSN